ncbi:hypothetical protein QR680_018466 [Steinernema hermaphroditum]|uniref:Uncharacterized protein n=1 Tax=Steinernema hermaphroditum TaxID=289476 RepID=A0AA39LR57_9BILA|nr:hypothetical protein QR680_018466 [Steinernema hermaphroditum]
MRVVLVLLVVFLACYADSTTVVTTFTSSSSLAGANPNDYTAPNISAYHRPYEKAPIAFNDYFLIVIISTIGVLALVQVTPFAVYIVLVNKPLSRRPTEDEIEQVEDDDDEEEENGNKKGGPSGKKKKPGVKKRKGPVKEKPKSTDFKFEDNNDGAQDVGTLIQDVAADNNVGLSQDTKTDLRSRN